MKVCITSRAKDVNSRVDERFGRAACFAILDTETGNITWIDNDTIGMRHGAGTGAVNLLANLGVQKILACAFGTKVAPLLNGLGIQMVMVHSQDTVGQLVKQLLN